MRTDALVEYIDPPTLNAGNWLRTSAGSSAKVGTRGAAAGAEAMAVAATGGLAASPTTRGVDGGAIWTAITDGDGDGDGVGGGVGSMAR